MSMLINAISALGNNSGYAPLLVRDGAIEVPTKIIQTYNQNIKDSEVLAKHAVRERSIDEYVSTAVWIGGVPTIEYLANKYIGKKGLNGEINYKLLENDEKALSSTKPLQQSLDINIKKFKDLAPKEVAEMEKVKANSKLFKNFTVTKYALALTIPVALMGFALPKANFALSSYLLDKDAKKGLLPKSYLKENQGKKIDVVSSDTNKNINYNKLSFGSKDNRYNSLNSFTTKKNNSPSFTGFASFMTGLTQQQKMMATDGGLTVGRVTTSRKKNEALENAFRMAGMLYLNFGAPELIDKGLSKMTVKLFGVNPELDPKIMANKRFLVKVRNDNLELPKCQDEVIDFLDTKPKSVFSRIVAGQGEVEYLKSGVRDPRKFVDTEKVFKLSQKLDKFGQEARNSGDVGKYAKKALRAKSANILTNIVVSSALLAIGLPQAQFLFRKLMFKSNVEPGLV